MANLNMITPLTVQGIINKFCFTIGMLPTSYKESLTYEEQLLTIGKYLEETVYPAINNNAEALSELQTMFAALQDYVNNYFDNLDVTEEINAKLDEMASDGTLANIINQEIFGEINDSISEINGDITDINNDITAINTTIDNLEIKPTIFIGDSYGRISNNSWVEKMAFKLGLTLGTNAWKFCRDGARFCT